VTVRSFDKNDVTIFIHQLFPAKSITGAARIFYHGPHRANLLMYSSEIATYISVYKHPVKTNGCLLAWSVTVQSPPYDPFG
jgi:hypothetical protein